MTLETLEARLNELVPVLQSALRTEMETVATDGLSKVIQRVSETGRDQNGTPFKPYTPAYEAFKRQAVGGNKSAKQRARRATAPASGDQPVGRFTGFVNFTLTGRMLSNIGLTEVIDTDKGVKVIVTGRTEETRGKMEGNDNYRKDWFSLSEKEVNELGADSKERMTGFAEQFLES
jgi:hypothetical protein